MKKLLSIVLTALFILSFGTLCFADELPYWYPEDVEAFEDYHTENAPRVVDDADIFSDDEEEDLTSRIEELISKYDRDFVIYTTDSSYGFTHQILAADFYQFNGYGLGDDYSGSVLMVCMESGNRGWYTAIRGESRSYYDEDIINAIDDGIYPDMADGYYYDAMCTYINEIDELYDTGTLSTTSSSSGGSSIMFSLIVAMVVGVIVGAIVLTVLYSSMKKVRLATEADKYIVNDSINIRVSHDYYLYSTVTRVKRENKSSGGGGGSSYSSDYSSSGGGSFSGGGRSF